MSPAAVVLLLVPYSSPLQVRTAAAPKKKVVAAKQEPEKKAPARQASDVSEPSSVADLAGRADPKTLDEVRVC